MRWPPRGLSYRIRLLLFFSSELVAIICTKAAYSFELTHIVFRSQTTMSAGSDTAGDDADAAVYSIFLDTDLFRTAAAAIPTIRLWQAIILPYLPFADRQALVKWSEKEQHASLVDTLESELRAFYGATFWTQQLRPSLIRHRAVITGIWPLRIVMGRPLVHTVDIVLLETKSKAVTQDDSPIAELWPYHNRPLDAPLDDAIWPCCLSSGVIAAHLAGRQTRIFPFCTPRYSAWAWRELDCCAMVYDPGHAGGAVQIASHTTLERLHLGQATYRVTAERPEVTWSRRRDHQRHGIVFDPIAPAALLAQVRSYIGPRGSSGARGPSTVVVDVRRLSGTDHSVLYPMRPGGSEFRRMGHVGPGLFDMAESPTTPLSAFRAAPTVVRSCSKPGRACLYDRCHPGQPHIHLAGVIVLLVHTGPHTCDTTVTFGTVPRHVAPGTASDPIVGSKRGRQAGVDTFQRIRDHTRKRQASPAAVTSASASVSSSSAC